MNILKEHSDLMIKSYGLTTYSTNISNEGIGSFIGKMSDFVINKFIGLGSLFSSNKDKLDNIKFEHSNNAFLNELIKIKISDIKEITNINYDIVRNTIVPTIVGLKVDFIKSTNVVTDNIKLIETNLESYLNETDRTISMILSDRDYRLSTIPNKPNDKYKKLNKDLDKNLISCFDNRKVHDTVKFSQLFSNMKSLEICYNLLVDNGKFVNLKNMELIKSSSTNIKMKIDSICEAMKERDFEISKSVFSKLTEDIELGAQLITNAASYIHWYDQSVMVLRVILEELKRHIK